LDRFGDAAVRRDRARLRRWGAIGSVDALVVGMLGLVIVRGVLLWGGEVVAQRAAGRLGTDLRQRLAASLVAQGPPRSTNDLPTCWTT
jgi:ABC-type transport system involved in cytochrome bd biosynthesis fused ATPase/permease subunit